MSSELVVRARGLTKEYPAYRHPSEPLIRALLPSSAKRSTGIAAVRGVDLEVARGETVGLIGRNGCGKSTLLQMICGTLRPTEGEIAVRGRVAALLELGAGFNRDFTGRENIWVNASILGLNEKEIEDRIEQVIEFSGIGDYIERPVRFYSSGMFARLAFAVAIHVDPDLLVVDEILAVGDEAFQRKCFARIAEIRARGAAILFVSHSAATVVELCDRALFMDEGEILFDGNAKQAVTHYHRVLYAPAARAAELRDELRHSSEPGDTVGSYNDAGGNSEVADPVQPARSLPDRPGDEFFDPDLVPESTVIYDVCGAKISRPRLVTVEGRPVNSLRGGGRYRFEYDVFMEQDCFDVRVHMLLKTVTGLELGGGVHPANSEAGLDLEAGTTHTVSFEFDCHLLAGVYFMNCGVTGNGGEQLHRVIDTLMFRVLAEPRASVFGIVNFACKPSLRETAG